jgi:hypothetical protein
MGLEPTTSTMARWRSSVELLPHARLISSRGGVATPRPFLSALRFAGHVSVAGFTPRLSCIWAFYEVFPQCEHRSPLGFAGSVIQGSLANSRLCRLAARSLVPRAGVEPAYRDSKSQVLFRRTGDTPAAKRATLATDENPVMVVFQVNVIMRVMGRPGLEPGIVWVRARCFTI